MATIWGYREGVQVTGDLAGYDVEATDGSIGKIDESTAEAGRSHVVVDTGFWIFGKKRLIPAGVVTRVDPGEEKVFLSITKDQVKDAPDWSAESEDLNDYTEYYGPYGW